MSQHVDRIASDTMSAAMRTPNRDNACEWCATPCSEKCSKCKRVHVCSKECLKQLWPTHKYICNKHTQAMIDPTMALVYAMDDPVYAASLVRLGNEDGEIPDFWLVLPDICRQEVVQYMNVETLCRTDSIMTNVLAREAWYEALRGSESVALSRWARYSSVDKFKSLRWSINRRVVLTDIKLWKVVGPDGRVYAEVGKQFFVLLEQPEFVDIVVMLVESRSIDASMEIVLSSTTLTPLYAASEHGILPVVQALLHAGADADKARDNGCTPLSIASEHGILPVVQALLQAGADADKANDKSATPLYLSSKEGHLYVVQALLDAKADVYKAMDKGITPLSVASRKGYLPVVHLLVQAGADVNKADNDGATPPTIASQQGHTHIVRYLHRVTQQHSSVA